MKYHLKATSVCRQYSHKQIADTQHERDQLTKAWLIGRRIFQSDDKYAGAVLQVYWTAATVRSEERG